MEEPSDLDRDRARSRLLSRLDAIAASLGQREDALALLALGSAGRDRARIDAHSDLDFFVLVRPGAKHRFLADLSWLDEAHPIAWSYRNTPDGHKALMADGVFCEFAVFEVAELATVAYAPGQFVWRRDEVAPALASPVRPLPRPADPDWLVGEALSNLIVGLGRYARGEQLAAMRLVQVHALDRLLELIEHGNAPGSALRDPFNVDRRLEQRLPGTALQLPAWTGGYHATPRAALALLAELEQHASVPVPVARHIRRLAGTIQAAD